MDYRPLCYSCVVMKAIRFLPLVYIVGVDGFVFFAPYLALVLTAGYTIRLLKSRPQAALLRPISV